MLKISVRDTGIGIKEENMNLLFQKFNRIPHEGQMRSTGLGLYIAKQLIQRLGGDIRAYSKFGIGSCFVLCLPCHCGVPPEIPAELTRRSNTILSRKSTQESTSSSEITSELRNNLDILIVDDDIFNIKILEIFSKRIGIDFISSAKNGLEAYENFVNKAREGKGYDFITMDLEMPVMNGKEACKKIRNYEKLTQMKPCRIIIISGNVLESEIQECLDMNKEIRAQAFFKKPIKFGELQDFIAGNSEDIPDTEFIAT
jgi:CheY-like chemotaxis protein